MSSLSRFLTDLAESGSGRTRAECCCPLIGRDDVSYASSRTTVSWTRAIARMDTNIITMELSPVF